MRAIIKFNFMTSFYYPEDIGGDQTYKIDVSETSFFKKGDEVEILAVVKDSEFHNGIGYVIYSEREKDSTTVGSHVLDLLEGE